MMEKEISKIIGNYSEDQVKDIKFSFDLVEESSDTIIVTPVGSINSYNTVFFQNTMEQLIDNGYKNLVFNMSSTKYVSAVGLGSFIHVSEKAKGLLGRISLNNMQKQVLNIFQLPGFSDYFSIDTDAGSAVLRNDYKNKVADQDDF